MTTHAPPAGRGPLEVDLRLALEHFALEVSFATEERVTGIFGASGSGKTSLLEALAGLRPRARGRIRFAGETWLDDAAGTHLPPERRDVGYVPQDGLLFPHLDVRGNLTAGWRRARRRAGAAPALDHVVALLELEPLLRRRVGDLSGGERQRVALGRALCSGPRLLLLDEPLASLDLPLRRKLVPLLRRLRAELEIPVLLVSHDPLEVQLLCDDLIVLERGRAVARGRPQAVLTDPAVFPLAAQAGFENVLPCTLEDTADGEGRLWIGEGERRAALTVFDTGDARRGRKLVGIPAHEIIIATELPRGLSARNVLAARIHAVRPSLQRALVDTVLAADDSPVTIEVAARTPAWLELAPGRQVFLVIKAASCRLYEDRAPTTEAGD